MLLFFIIIIKSSQLCDVINALKKYISKTEYTLIYIQYTPKYNLNQEWVKIKLGS